MKYFLILFAIIMFFSCEKNSMSPVVEENFIPQYESNIIFDTGFITLTGNDKSYDWGMTDENEIYVFDSAWSQVGVSDERPIGVDSIKIHFFWETKHEEKDIVFWMCGPCNIITIKQNQKYEVSTIKQNYEMFDLDFAIMFPDTTCGKFKVVGELFLSQP